MLVSALRTASEAVDVFQVQGSYHDDDDPHPIRTQDALACICHKKSLAHILYCGLSIVMIHILYLQYIFSIEL